MKRGLKEIYETLNDTRVTSYNHYPDEKGTERKYYSRRFV